MKTSILSILSTALLLPLSIHAAKLTASDSAADDRFGYSVSLSGGTGLVGAYYDDDKGNNSGSAYLFHNLDTATGSVTEAAKLIASDSAEYNYFGESVSLSGSIGLVGARGNKNGGYEYTSYYIGSAYVFRNLDTATGSVAEAAKLTASDGAEYDSFGSSVSLSGSVGLIGSPGGNDGKGCIYVFRNLDMVTGSVTEDAKLVASAGRGFDNFGMSSVSLSGSTALIGAEGDDEQGIDGVGLGYGAVYVFRNLDAATGIVTESLKLVASDGEGDNYFGYSTSLDGDNFLIGAYRKNDRRGQAYSGSLSSVSTLDEGNASRTISGISFTSREDWIIGLSTSNNTVRLSAGDTAKVTAPGTAVHIGQNASSEGNTLIIEGHLAANVVHIGSLAGNSGNTLQIEAGATLAPGIFRLSDGNALRLKGSYATISKLLSRLGGVSLAVWSGGQWKVVNRTNHTSLIAITQSGGYTNVSVPHPVQILTQPQAQLRYNGETANFSVTVTGDGPLKFQWYLNGKKIGGATKSTYAVKTATTKLGSYKVIVSNLVNSVTSNEVALTMRPAAYWSWSDSSGDMPKVNPGADVDFSVAGTVVGPAGTIKYQWMKDGKAVKNATGETLSLAGVTLADAGLYTLVITTGAGKVTTTPRRLIVNDETFLVYSIKGSGSYVSGTSTKQALTMSGFLLVDRAAKSGAIVWVDAKSKTFRVENYEDLSVESTGPSVGTVTALRSLVSSGGEHTTLWLTGTDALVALDKTIKTLAPNTMLGVLDVLKDEGAKVGVRAQTASLTLDKVKTLRTRTEEKESLAAEVDRITGELTGYTDAGALVTEAQDLAADKGFLVYTIKAPGSIATATGNTAYTADGFLLVDREAGRGAMVWINAKAKEYAVEIRENLAMKSPGDLAGALTALKAIEYDGTDDDTVWLTGTSAVNKLDKARTTLAPTTMTGVLNGLRLSGAVEIQTQKATLTLDKVRTLRTRTSPQGSLEAEVARITGALTGYTNITP